MSDIPQRRVLIIEDDDFLRTLAFNKLQNSGFFVESANDGALGYEKIKSNIYDVIILDLLLPNLDGFQILEKMRTEHIMNHGNIIVFSNLGTENDIQRISEYGITNYMIKSSFTLDELVAKIHEIIG